MQENLYQLWDDYKFSVEFFRIFQTEENQKIMQAHHAALMAAFTGGVVYQ